MTIHFSDPGYDFTPFIVCGIVAGAFFLIPLVSAMVHLSRNRRGNADMWGWGSLIVAVGVLIVCTVAAVGTGSGVYNKRIDAILYQEMAKAGFDGIQIERTRERGKPDNLDATFKGKPFVGTIDKLQYPQDHAFLIKEGRAE